MSAKTEIMAPPSRKDLTGPALRTFFRIAETWKLKEQDQMSLLGLDSRSTLQSWKRGAVAAIPKDALERISYILGIYKGLQILLPRSAHEWVHKPNRSPVFGGRSALERMTSGNVADLFAVRQYIDAQRGYPRQRGGQCIAGQARTFGRTGRLEPHQRHRLGGAMLGETAHWQIIGGGDHIAGRRGQPVGCGTVEPVGQDRDAAAMRCQQGQRGPQMAQTRPAVDSTPLAAREGRVHQHRIEALPTKMVAKDFGIMAGDHARWKGRFEQFGATRVALVEDQLGARQRGEDCEQAGARRRLEHRLAGPGPEQPRRQIGDRRGR